MDRNQRLVNEARAMGFAALYFACWIAFLILLKKLILAEYDIAFSGMSKALIGVLLLSKVVLVLERVSLGSWVRSQPAIVGVAVRTALYGGGVVVVLLLERAFEGRHEYGGFGPALAAVFTQVERHHVWANAIAVTASLLGYNMLSVIRDHVGKGRLLHMFLAPCPESTGERPASRGGPRG